MSASHGLLLAFLASLPLLAGCNGSTTERSTDSVAGEKEYDIQGKVTAIGSDKRSVKLDHEDIPGLMKGMEMEFKVDDPSILEGIDVGDAIDGRLRVQEGTYTVVKIRKR